MPIDNCPHTFERLAGSVLPSYFARLQKAMAKPWKAQAFVGPKSATKAILQSVGWDNDFPGCYVFLDREIPVYVGISRTVLKRIVQHLNYDTHNTASLVYKMAKEEFPHAMIRDQAMKDEQFKEVFFEVKERLQAMRVAFVEIPNDLELYLFEAYAAMQLDTDTWNTFRTH